jgi:hypothetical protein
MKKVISIAVWLLAVCEMLHFLFGQGQQGYVVNPVLLIAAGGRFATWPRWFRGKVSEQMRPYARASGAKSRSSARQRVASSA